MFLLKAHQKEALLHLAAILFVITFHPVATSRKVWKQVEAIRGNEALLPCVTEKLREDDTIFVILWYLNGRDEPIYSYDNRPHLPPNAKERHLVRSDSLEGRVFFQFGSSPTLLIKEIKLEDEANYTCRVDFRLANSRTTYIDLRVIIPPQIPTLKVGASAVYKPVLGPLLEGSPLKISCITRGGHPTPEVVWIKDEKVIDTSSEAIQSNYIVNQLRIPSLPRSFFESRLTCKAQNNKVASPALASVTLSMHLRPLTTKVVSSPKQFQSGGHYEVTCLTTGSRPSPNVTWSIEGLGSSYPLKFRNEHGINSTTSVLQITSLSRFNNRRLTCSAVNSIFPSFVLSDSVRMNVTYRPLVSVELGRGLTPTVKEHSDLYFNCLIDSNPPNFVTSWFHNGKRLTHSISNGILIGGHSLALRKIRRSQEGNYSCAARNTEGIGRSKPMALFVNYAPICALSLPPVRVLATPIGKSLVVSCDVVASPRRVRYSWVFNNSVTSERITGDHAFITNEGNGTARFTPRKGQDYGTLQCWAENDVGRMISPCFYHIVPAGRPESPSNCTVSNTTYDSITLECIPGFNGGLEQKFEAKVLESVSRRFHLNTTSTSPVLVLKGLTPGLDYVITVTSQNAIGRSSPIQIQAFTYKMAENRMRNNGDGNNNEHSDKLNGNSQDDSSDSRIAFWIGGILFLVTTCVFVFLLKIFIFKKRSNANEDVKLSSLTQEKLETHPN